MIVFFAFFLAFFLIFGMASIVLFVNRYTKQQVVAAEKVGNPTQVSFKTAVLEWAEKNPDSPHNKEVIKFLAEKGLLLKDDDGTFYKMSIKNNNLEKNKVKVKDIKAPVQPVAEITSPPTLDIS